MPKKKVFLAPPVYYGVCTTTKHHPGTINISPATLRSLSRDIVVDSHKKGLRNILLISGHGGGQHMAALKEVAEELIEELKGIKIAVFSPYDLLWKELSEIADTGNDSHAGEIETSMILARAPDGSFQPRPWHETLSMGSNSDVSFGEVWCTAAWTVVLACQPEKGQRPGLPYWMGLKRAGGGKKGAKK